MQLVIHSPFGSRVNRAWGLALRKRFCRSFNFELQAAATEDTIVLSLTTAHSFELEDVARYLHSNSVRPLLVQALCAAPMFPVRWRWSATHRARAAALSRRQEGARAARAHGGRGPADRGVPRPGGVRREPARGARDPRSPAGAPGDPRLPGRGDGHRGPRAAAARARGRRDPVARARPHRALAARARGALRAPLRLPRRRAARGAAHAGGDEPPLARPAKRRRHRPAGSGGDRARARGGLARRDERRRAARRAAVAHLSHARGSRAQPRVAGAARRARRAAARDAPRHRRRRSCGSRAERLPLFRALFPQATTAPEVTTPPAHERSAQCRGGPDRDRARPARGLRPGDRAEALATRPGSQRDAHRAGARGAAGGRLRHARRLHRRCRTGLGVVRAAPAGAHPPLYGQAAARGDRADRGARLPALPLRLAARRAGSAHGGPGRGRRDPRAAGGLRGAGERLGDRDPARAHRRVRARLAR